MAKELILPLTRNSPRSVDWKALADVERGDLVEMAGGTMGFAMQDAKKDEVVAVGIDADLVTVSQPDTARAWTAGEPVYIDPDRKTVGTTNKALARLGYVHNDTPSTESRVPIVWMPDYGHYFEELTGSTTPAMALSASGTHRLDSGQNLPLNQLHLTREITKTSLKGIRPGVPVHVTYEGAIYWRIQDRVALSEVTVSYVLWESVPSKIAVIEHQYVSEQRQNFDQVVSLDNFSIHFTLKPGDLVSRGRFASGAVTQVTQADFDNGIPIRVEVRFRAFKPAMPAVIVDERTRISGIHGEEMQMVTLQRGAPIE